MPIGRKGPGGGGIGNYAPRSTQRDSTGQQTSRVEVGDGVLGAQAAAIEAAPGIAPFSFYAATNSNGQMLRAGVAAAISVDLPFRGSIVGLAVRASGADTGTYTVHIDGTATEAAVALAAETDNSEIWEKSMFEAAAGQTLDVRITGQSGSNPVEAIVYFAIEPTTVL